MKGTLYFSLSSNICKLGDNAALMKLNTESSRFAVALREYPDVRITEFTVDPGELLIRVAGGLQDELEFARHVLKCLQPLLGPRMGYFPYLDYPKELHVNFWLKGQQTPQRAVVTLESIRINPM